MSYALANAGHSTWEGGWTELVRIYDGTANFFVEVGQQVRQTSVAAGDSAIFTTQVILPDPITFGSSGRFRIEVVPAGDVVEFLGQNQNNIALQTDPWDVTGSLTWAGNLNPIGEGTSRTVDPPSK